MKNLYYKSTDEFGEHLVVEINKKNTKHLMKLSIEDEYILHLGKIHMKDNGYCYIHSNRDGCHLTEYIHRIILKDDIKDETPWVDHFLTGDKLDNRRTHIKAVSPRENGQNQKIHRAGKLIGAIKRGKRWESQILHNGVIVYLGRFETEELANMAYIQAHEKIKNGETPTISELATTVKPINFFKKYKRNGGLAGCSYYSRLDRPDTCGPWKASCTIDGKNYHLGYHKTEALAHEAYIEFRKSKNLPIE